MLYPDQSSDIRIHLVLRVFLEGIYHSQYRYELWKTIRDNDMNIGNALEWALHLETVFRIEEEE